MPNRAVPTVSVAHIATVDMAIRYLLLNQLLSLRQAGYRVASVSSPGREVSAIEEAGIHHIPVRMTRRAFTPLTDLRSLWHLYRVMRQGRFTIIHTHTPKAGLLGRWAAKLAGVPVVVHTNHGFVFDERSAWLWRRFFVCLERLAARCCDLILCVSHEDVATSACEGIGDASKVVALGDGGIGLDVTLFDPDRFSPSDLARKRAELGLPADAMVVGFVGRLVREKGLQELLAAARLVQNRVPSAQLLIIGPVDAHKSDVIRPDAAHEYGVADICHFLGLRTDMPDLYAAMDVFVLPSHREGFPRAPMEASAMKVPCIVTDIRGCREAVEHGRNGLLVPVGDVQALADAIVAVLVDRAGSQRMGRAGRLMALERFDERLVFDTVRKHYARLLQEKGLAAPGHASSKVEELCGSSHQVTC